MRGIECRKVWKQYRMRGVRMLRDVFGSRRTLGDGPEAQKAPHTFWALADVSLEVQAGRALGVIGDNGAGKSTLLKIIGGVVWPTHGEVRVAGRVGALVDVGAGMHPELTGFENIFLYGTILGLSRKEIQARFDSIVEFSELEPFLDVPVKRYSSGMKIRLGFSVAAHLDPDILLVDEVLAVGDVAFQRKCLDRIRALREAGATILFVSHDLEMVERVCDDTILLRRGRVVDAGRCHDVVRRYREAVEREFLEKTHRVFRSNGGVAVERVVLTDAHGRERFEFRPGEWVRVHWHYRAPEGLPPVEFMVKVIDREQTTILAARSDGRFTARANGTEGVVQCAFRVPALASRTYQVWGHVVRRDDGREEVAWQPLAAFAVVRDGRRAADDLWLGDEAPVLEVPVRWRVDGRSLTDVEHSGRQATHPEIRRDDQHAVDRAVTPSLGDTTIGDPAPVASSTESAATAASAFDAARGTAVGDRMAAMFDARGSVLFALSILAGGVLGILLGALR